MNAHLKVDEAVKAAVSAGGEGRPRAVKMHVDPGCTSLVVAETFPLGASLAVDLGAIAAALDAEAACLVLFRLQDEAGSVPGAGESDWGLLAWAPDGAQRKQKMLLAASHTTVREALEGLTIKAFHATDRGDVTLEEFLAKTQPVSEADRRSAMTLEEQQVEDAKREMEQTRAAAPKKLAGLVALQLRTTESFTEAMAALVGGSDKAVLASLSGASGEELSGEVLDGVPAPPALRGHPRLQGEPRYVVAGAGPDRLVVISWLPEGAPVKLKMRYSTFKASLLQVVKEAAGGKAVVAAEVSEADDLTEGLGAAAPEAPEDAPSAADVAKPPGGFKPPAGGFRLPGM